MNPMWCRGLLPCLSPVARFSPGMVFEGVILQSDDDTLPFLLRIHNIFATPPA
jgi:hypothetical protein